MVISLGTGRMMIVNDICDGENDVCDSDIYNHEDDDNNDGINLLKAPQKRKKIINKLLYWCNKLVKNRVGTCRSVFFLFFTQQYAHLYTHALSIHS